MGDGMKRFVFIIHNFYLREVQNEGDAVKPYSALPATKKKKPNKYSIVQIKYLLGFKSLNYDALGVLISLSY
jgi:hypothetical protein